MSKDKKRVLFECVKCKDYEVDTADKMIMHFRIQHGIIPETFSAEKRKKFYDSFGLAENEFSVASEEEKEETNSPIAAEPAKETSKRKSKKSPQTISSKIYNLRKKHSLTAALSPTTKKRKIAKGRISNQLETPVGDVDAIRSQTNSQSSDESWSPCSDCSSDEEYTLPRGSHSIVDTGQSSSDEARILKSPVPKLSSDEAKQKNTSDEMASLIADFTAGNSTALTGTLYRCQHCSRCMGYSIKQLRAHHRRFRSSCVSSKSRDDHFVCPYCKTDYATEYNYTQHMKRFDGTCKIFQISESKRFFTNQAEAKIAMTLDKSDIESIEPLGPGEDEYIPTLEPFTHKGYLIPVENNTYKCPFCERMIGNRIDRVRYHLSLSSGICHKKKVASDQPQCSVCYQHFGNMDNLVNHIKRLRGKCRGHGNIIGDVRVDLIRLAQQKQKTKDSSSLYFCKHCGRCMGHHYRNLRNHLFVTQGKCTPNPAQRLYPCDVCKFDFTSSSSLGLHTKRFAGKCIDKEY